MGCEYLITKKLSRNERKINLYTHGKRIQKQVYLRQALNLCQSLKDLLRNLISFVQRHETTLLLFHKLENS